MIPGICIYPIMPISYGCYCDGPFDGSPLIDGSIMEPDSTCEAVKAFIHHCAMNPIMIPKGSGSWGSSNGTGADAPMTEDEIKEKTTNPAEVFSSIDEKKRKEMAAKEKAIKEKEEKYQKAKTDAEKDKIHDELEALREEYRKAEKELSNDIQLSKAFGSDKEFNFYSNISGDELTQIKKYNSAINAMKNEIAKIDKEAKGLREAFEKKKQELSRPYMPCSDEMALKALPKEKREAIEKINAKKNQLVEKIAKKIEELKLCIEKAAEENTKKGITFGVTLENRNISQKAEAPQKEAAAVAEVLSSGLFDEKGKPVAEDKIKAKIKELAGTQYSDDEISSVTKLLADTAKKSGNAEKFAEKLGEDEFLEAYGELFDTNATDEKQKKQATLLISIYDGLTDAGKFQETANKKQSISNLALIYTASKTTPTAEGQTEVTPPAAEGKGATPPAVGPTDSTGGTGASPSAASPTDSTKGKDVKAAGGQDTVVIEDRSKDIALQRSKLTNLLRDKDEDKAYEMIKNMNRDEFIGVICDDDFRNELTDLLYHYRWLGLDYEDAISAIVAKFAEYAPSNERLIAFGGSDFGKAFSEGWRKSIITSTGYTQFAHWEEDFTALHKKYTRILRGDNN